MFAVLLLKGHKKLDMKEGKTKIEAGTVPLRTTYKLPVTPHRFLLALVHYWTFLNYENDYFSTLYITLDIGKINVRRILIAFF